MQTDNYLYRAKFLIPKGIRTGAVLGFFSPLLYTALLFLLFFSITVSAPPSPHYDSAVNGSFIIGLAICMATVVPSTIIGVLGGILVAAILAIWRNGLANLWASLVGLVVGTIILVIVNYLIWRGLFLGVYAHDSFVDFIFPRGTDWVYFIINQNPFFIPSIIAVLLSTFGARQINKHVLLEQSTG